MVYCFSNFDGRKGELKYSLSVTKKGRSVLMLLSSSSLLLAVLVQI